MDFHPEISLPGLKVCAALDVRLDEALDRHPVLTARLAIDAAPELVLQAAAARLSWSVPHGPQPLKVFDGFVTQVNVSHEPLPAGSLLSLFRSDPVVYTLVAQGMGVSRDLARRTRSFGGGPAPEAIHKLPLLKDLLAGVEGIAALTLQVEHLLQCDETDWQFLVRLAHLAGLSVVTTPDGLRLSNHQAAKEKKLSPELLVEAADSITVSLGLAAAESLTWDAAKGEVPQAKQNREIKTSSKMLKALLLKADLLQKGGKHQAYPPCLGARIPDEEQATHLAQSHAAGLLRWRGLLRDPGVALGDVIRLPDQHPLDLPLFVTHRSLSYAPGARTAQLLNEVEAVPAGLGRPVPAPTPPGAGTLSVVGQVADSNDPGKLGRVKVNLPWQARTGEAKNWEGVWCRVPQPFGGIDAKNRPHGALHLPAPYDWVHVLVDPSGGSPPLVLGALYRGPAKAPAAAADGEHDRLLLLTAGGVRVLARDSKEPAGTSLTLAIADANGKDVCKLVLTGDGQIKVEAKSAHLTTTEGVEAKAKTVHATASDGMQVKAKTTLEGTLNVK
jgi:hypothetical protein